MALARYVITSAVTVPVGMAATPAAGEPGGRRGWLRQRLGQRRVWRFPQTFIAGTAIILDSAGALYGAIGAGNLRAYVQGQDDMRHAAVSS